MLTIHLSRAFLLSIAFLVFCSTPLFAIERSTSWDIPGEAKQRQNPILPTQASIGRGILVYAKNCQVCHGSRGDGDGPSSLSLGVAMANFMDPAIQRQSDGSLYWKITVGRRAMPNWQLQLSEEDRWHVVNFLRTMFSASDQHGGTHDDATSK
ncbi:MAG: cytochrome C [Nitrospiraceae bacterium]|nr:cytochrome C [Nitrospiraceae bacterium]